MRTTRQSAPKHQPKGVTLLYEDADILVVDKPSGLLTMGTDRDKSRTVHSILNDYVRKGNPKSIKDWDDLTKDGVEVITPNPFTSGGAKWNIMAAYGAQLEAGRSENEAKQYLEDLFANVPVQDKSAREALQTFIGGKGDVLLAYENEAITAQQKDQELDYTIPNGTILIQNPIAVTIGAADTATKFVEFARGEEAQRIFGEKGYRSIREDLVDEATYPTPTNLFTIDDLGGWSKVNDEFFDPRERRDGRHQQGPGVPD